jgi:tetratricopeptide (TPR) repeat protein
MCDRHGRQAGKTSGTVRPEQQDVAVVYANAALGSGAIWKVGRDFEGSNTAEGSRLDAMWMYARGSAYAATGKLKEAATEREALAKTSAALPADLAPDFMNPARTVMDLALTVLDARIAEAKGDRAGAIGEWKKAVAVWDTLAYNEPADWYYPVRESLGGVLLRDGKPAEAEAVFRRDLEINPRSGRSLYGLWQSLVAQKRDADAAWVKKQFDAAWARADVKLTVGSL